MNLTAVSLLASSALLFTPPPKWKEMEKEKLPSSVQTMCVKQSGSEYPASINVGAEPYRGTVKQYEAMMRRINSEQGDQWKSLGAFSCKNARGRLSQVEMKSPFGEVTLLHLVFLQDYVIYTVTAAAKKEEFAASAKEIFSALKNISLDPSPLTSTEKELLAQLIAEEEKILEAAPHMTEEEVFQTPRFQNELWLPVQRKISKEAAHYIKTRLTAHCE